MSVKLGDLFLCLDGGGHVFAETKDGRLVHISKVARGLACGCFCPGCGRRMVARQGSTAHHFAHYAEAGDKTCTSAGETALHKFAKQILNERLEIRLPRMVVERNEDKETIVKEKRYKFNEAILEKREGEIIPDVILILNNRRLIVEFKVTHACDEEKINHIKEADIAAIEIDLSQYRGSSLSEIADPILFQAPRSWLHNPKERDGLQRLEQRRQRRAAVARTAADKLRSTYASLTIQEGLEPGDFEELVSNEGLQDAIGHNVEGSVCFGPPLREWQSYIVIEWMLQVQHGFDATEVTRSLRRQGLIRSAFREIPAEVEAAAKLGSSNFRTPHDAVKAYLNTMSKRGFLCRRERAGWKASQKLWEIVSARRHSRAMKASRLAEMKKVIVELLEEVPETDLADFTIDGWIQGPLPRHVHRPVDAIAFADQSWASFMNELRVLNSDLSHPTNVPRDLMGLPLEAVFERKLKERHEAEMQRELAREIQRRVDAERRMVKIKERADRELSTESDAWLVEVNQYLGGLSPTAAAERGDADYHKACDALERLVQERQRTAALRANKSVALERLRKEAEKRFPTRDHASLWMRASLREIGSQSPQEYCVDERTMQECLSHLPRKRLRK